MSLAFIFHIKTAKTKFILHMRSLASLCKNGKDDVQEEPQPQKLDYQ